MSEQNLMRADAMLAHLKARGITVVVSGDQFRLQVAGGDLHDNDVAALRALLQALGLTTESAVDVAARSSAMVKPQGHLSPQRVAVPALVDPLSPAKGSTLSLPLVARDVEVLRHKAGAWFSSALGVGATLFAILLSRYQQKEDWLRELGMAIGQQAGPGEMPRAWFSLAPLIKRLPADGSLREGVSAVAEHLLDAAVAPSESLDLALALPDTHDEDQLVWYFAGDLFDEAFIRQLHADFVAIMRQATALITPQLSAISLYGTLPQNAVIESMMSRPSEAPVTPAMSVSTAVSVSPAMPDAAPVGGSLRESALWRTVQAVIDGHIANQGAAAPAPVQQVATEWQRYPLSPQQWLFALDEQKYGPGARHSITSACFIAASNDTTGVPRTTGVVDLDKAQKALSALMKRHAILRTTFEWQATPEALQQQAVGSPVGANQCVHASPALPWRALVLSTTEPLHEAARQWLYEASAQTLPLFSGLPWQASVATVSNGVESASVWRLSLHNALADRIAADRLMMEWQQLYAGEALAAPAQQYGDYCRQQQAAFGPGLQLDANSDAWAFWYEQLQPMQQVKWPLLAAETSAADKTHASAQTRAPTTLNVPADIGRQDTLSADAIAPLGATHSFVLDAELMQRVRVAALGWQVSVDSILLTAFAALLRRYVDQDRFIVGVEFSNRQNDVLQQLSGVVSNVLPLVVHLDDHRAGVRHRVEHAHGQLADMAHYQSTPLLAIMPLLSVHREDAAQLPLSFAFSCQTELTDAARQWVARGLQPVSVARRQPRVALGLNLRCSELQASEGELEYYADWLTCDAAAEFIAQYMHLLGAMVSDANAPLYQLPLMSLSRQQEMFDLFNREAQSLPSFLPHFTMWWQRQCYSAPQNLAVVAAEGRMSFAELDALANQIARYLVSQEIGAGDRIGLLLPRDPVMLATVLAIFKVGAAWVPVHAQWPLDYQEAVLSHAGVVCVVHDAERMPWQGSLKALDFSITATPWHALDSDSIEDADDPASLACILYPVAVTATPQGISIAHRNLSALVAWGVRLFEHRPALRAAFTQDLCAESALFEVFVTLCSGGAVVLMDDLLAPMARERPTSSAAKLLGVVNHLTITPTLAGEMLREGLLPKGLRSIALLGEPASAPLRAALLAQPGISDVLQLHKCAENSGVAFVATFGEHAKPAPWRATVASDMGVGSPIDGTQCVILNGHGQLQPWGVAGDLYIGGAALCASYGAPAGASNSRFIKNPLTYFPTLGSTLFHTGYRACWHADGRIELLAPVTETSRATRGLVDRLRVEQRMSTVLGDAPAALCRVNTPGTDQPARVAFIKGELPARHYLQLLQRHLPAALCPERVSVVGIWPRTPHDELDRAALTLQYVEGRSLAGDATPNTLELQMLRLWQDVLGEGVVDIDTDFISAGGYSLLAVQLAAQLAQRYALQRVPSFTSLMQYPTPRRMARWLDAALRGEESRTALWEPLSDRVASRSLLCFDAITPGAHAASHGGADAESGVPWLQVAQALPATYSAFRVCAQLRDNDEPATLVQRYVDAIEQESLPLPAALAGEGAGAVLAAAVAREMHARGWPWLPVVLIDSAAPTGIDAIHSLALHVNSAPRGIAARADWFDVLQGDVQWRLENALFTGESAAPQVARWINGFLLQAVA